MAKQKTVLLMLFSGILFQNAQGASCISFYKQNPKSSFLDKLGVTAAIERVRKGQPLPRAAHELFDIVYLQGDTSQIKSSRYYRSVSDKGISVEPDIIFAPSLDSSFQQKDYLRDSINKDEIYNHEMSKRQENPVYDVPDIFIKNNHGPSDSTVINVRDATGTIVKTHEVVEKINSVLEQKLGVLNILVESMVPIKVNAQSQEVLVSFTGRQKLSWEEIRAIESQNLQELVHGRPASQRLGLAVIDLKTGRVVKASYLPHEIDSITADSSLDRISGMINGELGEVSLSALQALPSFSKEELSSPVALDGYRKKLNALIERDLSYLKRAFGLGYEPSTIFSDYGSGKTPAIVAGRFDKGLVLVTKPNSKQLSGLSDMLHFVVSPSSGMTATFTRSLKDLVPELFKSMTLVNKISVEDFKQDKLVLRVTEGKSPSWERLVVIDYKMSQDRHGAVTDFEVKNVNFNWANPSKGSTQKVILSSDGNLFEIGKNKKGSYLRSLQPGRENKLLMLPEFDQILGVEVSDLGNAKVQIFHGGQFKTVVFNLESLDAL